MSGAPLEHKPAPSESKLRERWQFSLRRLLLVTTGIAVVCVMLFQWGPWGWLLAILLVAVAFVSTNRQPWQRGEVAVQFILVVFLLGVVSMLLKPYREGSHYESRRSACSNNLKQIALALHTYHHTYGSFPPAYVADEHGRPMHSWRVLILPFIEEQPLYDDYRFDEPWDGPNNRLLADRMPRLYRCPSESQTDPPSLVTSYLAVVGPETVWPDGKARKFGDIQDGTSNTLLVVESHNSGIHWMEPRDLHTGQMAREINPLHGQGICSCHGTSNDQGIGNMAQAVLVDGSVRSLPNDLTRDKLEALLTIAGGEADPLD